MKELNWTSYDSAHPYLCLKVVSEALEFFMHHLRLLNTSSSRWERDNKLAVLASLQHHPSWNFYAPLEATQHNTIRLGVVGAITGTF